MLPDLVLFWVLVKVLFGLRLVLDFVDCEERDVFPVCAAHGANEGGVFGNVCSYAGEVKGM